MRILHRSSRAIPAALLFFLILSVSPAQAQQLIPEMESPILAWTNMTRQSYGRWPLVHNPQLTRAAQMHALNMAAQETMSHSLDGLNIADRAKRVGYPYAAVGENVAYNFGYPNPAWTLYHSWLISPGHLQNILNPQFAEIGVGVAWSATGKVYACQVFGRRLMPGEPSLPPYANYRFDLMHMPEDHAAFYFLTDDLQIPRMR